MYKMNRAGKGEKKRFIMYLVHLSTAIERKEKKDEEEGD